MNNKSNDLEMLCVLGTAISAELTGVVETQTLLQLLVKKGVITREEVTSTRKSVVENDTKVHKLCKELAVIDDIVEHMHKQYSDRDKFSRLFFKMMNDRDSMTDEEIDYLDSKLDFKKYWKDDN